MSDGRPEAGMGETPAESEPDLTLTSQEVDRYFDRLFDAMKAFEEDEGLATIAERRAWGWKRLDRTIVALAAVRGKIDAELARIRIYLTRLRARDAASGSPDQSSDPSAPRPPDPK